jgi:hypothetical protein
MQITKVHHDGDESVYKVVDDATLQGQYFVIVNAEERTLSVSSLDLAGLTDESDLLLISARIPLDEPEIQEDAAVWPYIDDEDLAKKLLGILGEHAAIVLQDLGNSAYDPDGSEWQAALATGEEPVELEPAGMVAMAGQEFSFDPEPLKAGDAGADGDELDGGGGAGGDFGSGSDPGAEPGLPPPDDDEEDDEEDLEDPDAEDDEEDEET